MDFDLRCIFLCSKMLSNYWQSHSLHLLLFKRRAAIKSLKLTTPNYDNKKNHFSQDGSWSFYYRKLCNKQKKIKWHHITQLQFLWLISPLIFSEKKWNCFLLSFQRENVKRNAYIVGVWHIWIQCKR